MNASTSSISAVDLVGQLLAHGSSLSAVRGRVQVARGSPPRASPARARAAPRAARARVRRTRPSRIAARELALVLRAERARAPRARSAACALGLLELAAHHPERAQRHAQLERRRGLRAAAARRRRARRAPPRAARAASGGRAARARRAASSLARASARPAPAVRERRGACACRRASSISQQVPLDLARAPADHRVLDRARRAGQMRERLHHADHPPAQRPVSSHQRSASGSTATPAWRA